MNNFNNLYNFKNPIRHFFNLDNFKFDNSQGLTIDNLCWTSPIKFKIFKTEEAQRVISFPNILNFYYALTDFEQENNFYNIPKINQNSRVSPDLKTGEFSVLSYYNDIQRDAFNLTKYDKLLILDIKGFYGRIYTHDFKYDNTLERRLTSLNAGRTNGILLGSYLSLYVAEIFLSEIEKRLNAELNKNKIDCHYEYFSDDFYFFCNISDLEKIKNIFSTVLEEYEMQINNEKTIILDFDKYTSDNNLEKLWKKIISNSIKKDRQILAERKVAQDDTFVDFPTFFTQVVYRVNQIPELKYKRIFLANFFKTNYFYSLDCKIYKLSESDFNYICYIYKLMPETILYSIHKIKEIQGFDYTLFKEFVCARFKSELSTKKYEEQIYFYYAIKVCDFDSELDAFKNDVLKSKNQILISYFIRDKIISANDYTPFINPHKESEWLQNYHYLLTYDKSQVDILLPDGAKKSKQKDSYRDFYRCNLNNDIPILKPINEVTKGINNYLEEKINSY